MRKPNPLFNDFDYKLFGTLCLLSLFPTLYTTLRIYFIADIPGDWGFNIASQLAWLQVSYEVIHEAILLPMIFLLGRYVHRKTQFQQAVSTGLFLVFILYLFLALVTILFTRPLVIFMEQIPDLIDATVTYIRLEAISLLLGTIARYLILVLIVLKKEQYLLRYLFLQMILSVGFDSLFFGTLSFSLGLGVNGIAYTNILVHGILLVFLFYTIQVKYGFSVGRDFRIDTAWLKDWFKIGGRSGLESFIRNAAFILMIIRLVNVVQEQGNFWVTNSFIWGWLLLPVLAFGDLIQREVATDERNILRKSPQYFLLTGIFVVIWFLSMPFWGWFIQQVMGIQNYLPILELAYISIGFYMVFAFNHVIDSIFYGRGRTDLMLYQSLIVNTLFYGTAFLLYVNGVFIPTLVSIAVLFGLGIVFDSIITFGMFVVFVRKLKMRTL